MRRRRGVTRGACRLALTLIAFGASLARAGPILDPSCGTLIVVPRPGSLVLALPHSFIREGSDSLWSLRGTWRPGIDYSLDRARGELRLLREAVPGETLHVHACWLLDPPPLEVQRERYRPIVATDTAGPAASPIEPRPVSAHALAPPSGASLALNGNKTLAVEFGSAQDAVLRQSLDLALSGTLAPGVELTGVLTDRNTPVTSTGSTLALQAVDQVRLEITTPQGGATLGDLSMRFDDGEFARLDRRLQGARGEWNAAGFQVVAAAASATGEYNREEFYGIEGQQGPYILTDRNGAAGVAVVAGSEVVTLDGTRLARGESADYFMDYERARLTFTSRRLITSASRITVDYQYTLQRYRRNFTSAGTRWERGALHGFARMMSESDDRSNPLGTVLDAGDRLALAAAGDSTSRALGIGITSGGGDYDTVRVSPGRLVFAYAGPDSGMFAVQFASVGPGKGDYADSALVAGRNAYRFVGAGAGAFVVGRPLPLPESHALWAGGAGVTVGAASIEFEGAASRHDLNTFSRLDDGDNAGYAGRAKLRLEGRPRGLGGRAELSIEGRTVDAAFAPFARLQLPFEAEHWGVPASADFEHARRVSAAAEWSPASGGRLMADVGRIATPDGVVSRRASVAWDRAGRLETHMLWERAASEQASALDPRGSRDHARGEARYAMRWLVPALHAEMDTRRFPSDSGHVGDRFRSVGGELVTGAALSWHVLTGLDVRRDGRRSSEGFIEASEARTERLSLESPSGRAVLATLLAQRRDVSPIADPIRTRSDLASARLRGEHQRRGLLGEFDVELGSEGENRRTRTLTYAGPGKGAYDALGNFVGVGDYVLVITVSPGLDRLARVATRGRAAWTFGASDPWRGSRIEWTSETEARRSGDITGRDVLLSPAAALGNVALEHGTVLERLESDLAPQSNAAALRLLMERRVSADRSFENFVQTTDDRQIDARWRAHPAVKVSTELDGSTRTQRAEQVLTGVTGSARTILTRALSGQLMFTPDARLRVAGAAELSWARAADQSLSTRTLLVGPDLGFSVGRSGRTETSVRRAFVSGPPAVALIPSADPAGAPRWQGTSRFDYRLLESFTVGLSAVVREFAGRRASYTGRAEMRAFF